jgi:adenine-specific DNA-methyltransferase
MGKSWHQSPIKSATDRILCFWSGTKIIVIEANGYPGLAVFDPSTGEFRSDEPDNNACWFIDSDYNGESFFVRQAYFLGQNDPYKSLKTSLKAEIDQEAWESLNSDISVPFAKPSTGRIAVKAINHLGDEVMKVYRVGG